MFNKLEKHFNIEHKMPQPSKLKAKLHVTLKKGNAADSCHGNSIEITNRNGFLKTCCSIFIHALNLQFLLTGFKWDCFFGLVLDSSLGEVQGWHMGNQGSINHIIQCGLFDTSHYSLL